METVATEFNPRGAAKAIIGSICGRPMLDQAFAAVPDRGSDTALLTELQDTEAAVQARMAELRAVPLETDEVSTPDTAPRHDAQQSAAARRRSGGGLLGR